MPGASKSLPRRAACRKANCRVRFRPIADIQPGSASTSAPAQTRPLEATFADPDIRHSTNVAQRGMPDPNGSSLAQLSAFLARLDDARIAYQLASVREGAVMVQIAVPGERWEVEFFSDRPTEVEVFRSDGAITGPNIIESLFSLHDS